MDFNNILDNLSEKDLERLIVELEKSEAFKVLSGKTQIKNDAAEGYRDDLNTRQDHSRQVSNIARNITASAGMSKKEQLIAGIVGLCHDLGHTPFGHDGEEFFSKKNGEKFNHAKYGKDVFRIVYDDVISTKKKNGTNLFSNVEALKQLGTYIEAGISFHQEGYYAMDIDKEIKELEERNPEELTESQSLQLKAFRIPCIQAGMLSDTVAIMQTDTYDMSMSDKPFESDRIITVEDQLEVTQKIGFEVDDIDKMASQLFEECYEGIFEGKSKNEKLQIIIEKIGELGPEKIQGIIAVSIGERGLNDKGRFESLTDEYKLLADDWKKGYIKYIEMTMPEGTERDTVIDEVNSNWKQYREEGLREQRDLLRVKNPLLCLTYEIQNELMYNEIIKTDSIKFLNNDLDRNYAIFSRVYDYVSQIQTKEEAELTPLELEIRSKLDEIKECPQIGEKKDLVRDKTTYFMQQLGNNDLKEIYSKHIELKEEKILKAVKKGLETGISEEKIAKKLGIDEKEFSEYSNIDKSKRIAVMLLSGKKKDEIIKEISITEDEYNKLFEVTTKGEMWEIKQPIKVAEDYLKESGDRLPAKDEIVKLLRIEKRDLEELQSGKSTIERYVEYKLDLKKMDSFLGRSIAQKKVESIVQESGVTEGKERLEDVVTQNESAGNKQGVVFGKSEFSSIAGTRKKDDIEGIATDVRVVETQKGISTPQIEADVRE